MKVLFVLVFCCITVVCSAQKTPDELAKKAFYYCLHQNEKAFMRLYPSSQVQTGYFKQSDPKNLFPKGVSKQVYPKGESGAKFGYTLFPQAIKEFGINPKDIVFGKNEAVENDIEIYKEGKKVGTVYNKIISVYFTSGGRRYAFVVPNAIAYKGRWYMSDRVVSIHELDANGTIIE